MPSLLEDYLSEVALHLKTLPVKRRKEELREMRAHLQNAVTVSQELGQSEEDAELNAVQEFGTAEDLGGNLVWAWQRGRSLDRKSFWGATACTFLVLFLTASLEGAFIKAIFNPISPALLPWAQSILLGISFLGPLVSGAVTGISFSKRAVRGNIFGVVAYSAFCICVYCHWLIQPGHLNQLGPISHAVIALRFLVPLTVAGLASSLAAWVSSRGRLIWSKRRPLVGG